MTHLNELQPRALWHHFLALSAIPRLSCEEGGAAKLVLDHAAALGLEARRDNYGNVLVRKPASPGHELSAAVILQAHLDMVGQKRAGSSHDFHKDPLRLHVKDGWVHATDTTLGADNGVGVAACLAVLGDRGLVHGPLSALFTVEEEIGLKGAAKVPAEFLDAPYLINLDSDSPEEVIIGCAGSLDLRLHFRADFSAIPSGWQALELRVSGCQGGHSGADIHRQRSNGLLELAGLLDSLPDAEQWRLVSFEGGDARNAIPREARAVIVCPPASLPVLSAELRQAASATATRVHTEEPGFSFEVRGIEVPSEAAGSEATRRYVEFLTRCPNGVRHFCVHPKDAVRTSSNLGVMARAGDSFTAHFLVRSAVDEERDALGADIMELGRGLGARSEVLGCYSGWQPDATSPLVAVVSKSVQHRLGHPARTAVVHGGLECGLLKGTNPALQCISIGPRIENMHSPDERLEIRSMSEYWDILVSTLASLAKA